MVSCRFCHFLSLRCCLLVFVWLSTWLALRVKSFLPQRQNSIHPVIIRRLGVIRRYVKAVDNEFDESPTNTIPSPPAVVAPRIPQIRPKHGKNRRPKNYWLSVKNVDKELRQLWASQNITIQRHEPPPIPNESLLNYWKRHDLRAAIVTHNGREELAELLGGSFIIPGRWKDAVRTSVVQEIMKNNQQSQGSSSLLDSNNPPLSPQQIKHGKVRGGGGKQTKTNVEKKTKEKKQQQQEQSGTTARRSLRKPAGYWTNQQVLEDLFEYLSNRKQSTMLPAVYQPQLSELDSELRNAINRWGSTRIFRQARLVPYREWKYIEGMYDMLLELRKYLDEFYEGNYDEFPIVYEIKQRGYERLHGLIQYYGGRKLLASKFDMLDANAQRRLDNLSYDTKVSSGYVNWGNFDLLFAIQLLGFVRNEYMKKQPPLSHPAIEMPMKQKLLDSGSIGKLLDEKIMEYGGYENVARRLQLDLPFTKNF